MAGIPAGMESSSDSDGELFYSGEDPQLFLKKYEKRDPFKKEYNDSPKVNSTQQPNHDVSSNGTVPKDTSSESVELETGTGSFESNKGEGQKSLISPALYDDLRLAILQRNLELTKDILEMGISVDTILKSGWTALMYACSLGDADIVQYLLSKGANPNFHKDLFDALMAVCASKQNEDEGLLKCVKLLLDHGARPNVWDRHHMTPLMFAAREGHYNITSLLISKKCDMERLDNQGWSALCWAAHSGNGRIARLLLEAGADASKMTLHGQTASEIAFSAGYEELGDIIKRAEKQTNVKFTEKDLASLNSNSNQKNIPFAEFEAVEKKTKVYNSSGDLELFLVGLNLGEWFKLFRYHELEFHEFLLLTEEDLISMGIDKIGVRNKILEGIKGVHKKKWERSSLPDIRRHNYLSCPDAVTVMSNVGLHIQYMHSTVRYLRRQLQQKPRILELGQEQANVKRLLKEAGLALSICGNMKEELRFFERHLDKIQDNIELNPGDLIVQTKQPRNNTAIIVTIMGTTLVAAFYLGWQKPDYLRRLVLLAQPWQTCAS